MNMLTRTLPATVAAALGCAMVCVVLLVPRSAHAYLGYTLEEIAGLPPYCMATRLAPGHTVGGALWKHWQRQFGPSWDTMHHYCAGQMRMREARRYIPESQEHIYKLRLAIDEFNFLLRAGDAALRGFPLWAEMLSYRGRAAVLLGDMRLAFASYEKARRVQPTYWPAYLDWVDVLVRLKLHDQARDVLRSGLTVDPTVMSLRTAYVKLGGSLAEFPLEPPGPAAPAAQASTTTVEAVTTVVPAEAPASAASR